MEFYTARRDVFVRELSSLNNRYNTVSIIRLVIAVVFLTIACYSIKRGGSTILITAMVLCAIGFFILMRWHTTLSVKKIRAAALLKVNNEEIDYLSGKNIAFDAGDAFIDHKHPYSHDLDIFGRRSLFHNLNRTETYRGQQKLAGLLLNLLPQETILQNQEAIKELARKPEWRQEIMALGKSKKDSEAVYNKLINWISNNTGTVSAFAVGIAFASPIALAVCSVLYLITGNSAFSTIAGYMFGFNLVFILFCMKKIKNEINYTTDIHDIIHHYGLIILQLENEIFSSEKLKSLQNDILPGGKRASIHIKKLALLFSRMDIINNVLAAALLNGLLLFHFHTLRGLLAWKEDHAQNVGLWLDAVAEAEALSSLGNLYYNNPDFTFPILNNDHKISFKNLAHPLIKKGIRIGNDISFNPAFTILTGSNMSGKSTFLRSLGITMVLAGTGAPVCAEEAFIHPLPVLVSMRLADSLSDSESYFFAEIKRLREIMDVLQGGRAFVLLDEILRGTNSDDKRTGTIKVVEKMIMLNAIGAIATHDIEVCNSAAQHPGELINRCFEVQIVNNELYFDYRLRDGICQNKSATFIMQKMGVI